MRISLRADTALSEFNRYRALENGGWQSQCGTPSRSSSGGGALQRSYSPTVIGGAGTQENFGQQTGARHNGRKRELRDWTRGATSLETDISEMNLRRLIHFRAEIRMLCELMGEFLVAGFGLPMRRLKKQPGTVLHVSRTRKQAIVRLQSSDRKGGGPAGFPNRNRKNQRSWKFRETDGPG